MFTHRCAFPCACYSVPATFSKFGRSQIGACIRELERADAKATLFVMSRELDMHPRSVREELVRAVSRGFELGNHDVKDVKTILRSREEFRKVTRE